LKGFNGLLLKGFNGLLLKGFNGFNGATTGLNGLL
jgi:hypothetical protein